MRWAVPWGGTHSLTHACPGLNVSQGLKSRRGTVQGEHGSAQGCPRQVFKMMLVRGSGSGVQHPNTAKQTSWEFHRQMHKQKQSKLGRATESLGVRTPLRWDPRVLQDVGKGRHGVPGCLCANSYQCTGSDNNFCKEKKALEDAGGRTWAAEYGSHTVTGFPSGL